MGKRNREKRRRDDDRDDAAHLDVDNDHRERMEKSVENEVGGPTAVKHEDGPEAKRDRGLDRVAMDCEMVEVQGRRSACARVCVVDQDEKVLYHSFVVPNARITNFRTRWSGIRPRDMRHATKFKIARSQVQSLLRGKILVGHAVANDLNALEMDHPKEHTRDTATYMPLRKKLGGDLSQSPSLRRLSLAVLDREIQRGEHNPEEDAKATMALYNKCERRWEKRLRRNARKGQ